ncbi:hypothetical protein ACLOJK_041275 [Asimina triloba]
MFVTFVMADRKNEGNDLILLELIGTVEDGKSQRLFKLVNSVSNFIDLARFDVFPASIVAMSFRPILKRITVAVHGFIFAGSCSSNEPYSYLATTKIVEVLPVPVASFLEVCNLDLAGGGLHEQFISLDEAMGFRLALQIWYGFGESMVFAGSDCRLDHRRSCDQNVAAMAAKRSSLKM